MIGALALGLTGSGEALAAGFTDYDETLRAPHDHLVDFSGSLRLRGEVLDNLDLDRGPTPSGQLLYPVPLSDPKGQILTRADMRLRTDVGFFLPAGGLAVKVRLDAFDGMALGSAPVGIPSASTSQQPGSAVLRLKRAYGEALTPFGLLTAGRMGNQFGLGMLANSGDCADCDSGDASDRIAFVTPILGHIFAVAYDLTSVGPFVPDKTGVRPIDVDPTAFVNTITTAFERYHTPWAIRRRSAADKATFDYGAAVSHRWQKNDVPATYLPTVSPVPIDSHQVMARGFTATTLDAWLRLVGPGYRIEGEAALIFAKVEQGSLIPGFRYKDPVTSRQIGFAIESEFGDKPGVYGAGLDLGFASGDKAPGFGAFPKVGAPSPKPGDLDGAQANPPYDTTVNNFRFNPDYRIDRILFREIIGTVTDAVYLKPHVRVDPIRFSRGALELSLFSVFSFAVEPTSTPSGNRPLGVEIDPTIAYRSDFGFQAALEQGTLIPLSGLDNPELRLNAKPAQVWRVRLAYSF